MVRFLHSADWHWGRIPKSQDENALRAVRALAPAIRNLAELGHREKADFVLVAGDVFDANGLPEDSYKRFAETMCSFDPLPVYLISGNHDPACSRSVWKEGFPYELPENIHVLSNPCHVELCEGQVLLLANPVETDKSTEDPTEFFSDSAGSGDPIRIGFTHGSLMVDDFGKKDEHPIPADATHRHNLDYLALGHWHSWFEHGGRIVYPGVLQPWNSKPDRGKVALVEIDRPGAIPRIFPRSCAAHFPKMS